MIHNGNIGYISRFTLTNFGKTLTLKISWQSNVIVISKANSIHCLWPRLNNIYHLRLNRSFSGFDNKPRPKYCLWGQIRILVKCYAFKLKQVKPFDNFFKRYRNTQLVSCNQQSDQSDQSSSKQKMIDFALKLTKNKPHSKTNMKWWDIIIIWLN